MSGKILSASGIEELDHELGLTLPEYGMEMVGTCYHKGVLEKVARETGADTVIVSPALAGDTDFVELVYYLRMAGLRVVILPGNQQLESTQTLVKKVIPFGIYDFIYDRVRVEDIINKLLNPGSMRDLPPGFARSAMEDGTALAKIEKNLPGNTKGERGIKERLRGITRVFGGGKSGSKKYTDQSSPADNSPASELIKTSLPEGFLIWGNVPGQKCYTAIEGIRAAEPDAVLVFSSCPDFLKLVKEFRREYAFLSVPVVVVGECNTSGCFKAGADECVPVLDGKAVAGIMARAERYKEIREKTSRDDLTGLYKRNFLNEYLSEQERRNRETGALFSILMIDLDHFKKINDNYGHQAGDAVLKKFAAFLQDGVRKVDVVARYGGEEFVVVFPGTGIREAFPVAGRLRQLWEKHKIVLPSGVKVSCTFSAGMAEFNGSAMGFETLITLADQALYRAKEAGRNRVSIAGDRPCFAAKVIFVSGPEGAFIASNLAASLTWQGSTVYLVDLTPDRRAVGTFSTESVVLEQVTGDLAGAWKKGGRPRELPGLLLISGPPDIPVDELSRKLLADFIIVHAGVAQTDIPIKGQARIIQAYKNDMGSVVIRAGDGLKETFFINTAHLSAEMDRAGKRSIPVMLLSPELANAFSILSQNILKGGNEN